MKRATIFAAIVALAACGDPPLKIVYRVAGSGGGQVCGTSSCLDIKMACPSVLHLRILSPSDPTLPYVSICEPIPQNAGMDLCAIANIDLAPENLPRKPLEIQVTIWPLEAVLDENGMRDCQRTQVEFDAIYGFPTTPEPAFGGRAFYQPGDEETVVTLGCTNVAAVNAPTCTGPESLDVTATMLEFENLPFLVTDSVGDGLFVAVGEPELIDGGPEFALIPDTTTPLTRTVQEPPTWGGGIKEEDAIDSIACLQSFEVDNPTTASLRCRMVGSAEANLEITGVRVSKTTVDQILGALGLMTFPVDGMTMGIVLDLNGTPIPGVTVTSTAGTIEYINANRTGIAPGNQTTASGIFVSRDAPFGTSFSVALTPAVGPAIGGRVRDKLTVIHFEPSDIGGQ